MHNCVSAFDSALSIGRISHIAGNMNDRWQLVKTRKLGRQTAASGERERIQEPLATDGSGTRAGLNRSG